jgi:hypothetical protein
MTDKTDKLKPRHLEDDPRCWCRCGEIPPGTPISTSKGEDYLTKYLKKVEAHYRWEQGRAVVDALRKKDE